MNDDAHAQDIHVQIEEALRAEGLRRVPDSVVAPPFPVSLNNSDKRQRRRWLVPVTVAAAVAVVVGVAAGLGNWSHHPNSAVVATLTTATSVSTAPHSSGPVSALGACPSSYDASGSVLSVPRNPEGFDGAARLVPQDAPIKAVICAYDNAGTVTSDPGGPLTGARTLTSGLPTLAEDLTWSPRLLPDQGIACAGVGRIRKPAFLLGLTYSTGTEWVSSALTGGCPDTSNGVFVTPGNIGEQVQASYAAGAWVPAPVPVQSLDACQALSGRLGQETALVPPQARAVKICRLSSRGKQVAVTVTSDIEPLVHALDALPTKTSTSTGSCQGDGSQNIFYELLFSYPEGPDVWMSIDPHCTPSINNFSLQSQTATSIVPLLDALLKR